MRIRTVLAAVAGGTTVWFLDPKQGRRRRAVTRDRVAATRRRIMQAKGRAERYRVGVEAGQKARERGAGRYHVHSYADLREHLRGEIHRLGARDVNVDVDEDRRVTLRGQVDDRAHEAVLSTVATTPGVAEVIDLTHRPGQVAPNKAAALEASGRADGQSRGTTR